MGIGDSKDTVQMRSRDYFGAGKVAIVTGPTGTGIGFHTARWLAERGVHVILAGRSQARLSECEANIRNDAKNADGTRRLDLQLTALILDLGSLASIESFVASFFALSLPRLDMLINNAGIVSNVYATTPDDIELTFGTNHVGVQYLTQQLMPRLIASAPSRIVSLSSSMHKMSKITNDNVSEIEKNVVHVTADDFGVWTAYSNSKLCNMLMTRVLNRRYASLGVTAYSADPGWVATEINRDAGLGLRLIMGATSFMAKSPEDGAGTSIYCATHAEALASAGLHFEKCAVASSSSEGANDPLADAVWSRTEDVIAKAKAKRAAKAKSIITEAIETIQGVVSELR